MLTAENLSKLPNMTTEENVGDFRRVLAYAVRPKHDHNKFIKSYQREPARNGTDKLPQLPEWTHLLWENPQVIHAVHQYHRELRKLS